MKTSSRQAYLVEVWYQEFEARNRVWVDKDLLQTYESLAAGEPCRACGRALLGNQSDDTSGENLERINADNAAFRAAHTGCVAGVWSIMGRSVLHCVSCCPPPPPSPSQRETILRLLKQAEVPPDRRASWGVKFSCGHVEIIVPQTRYSAPDFTQCSACNILRFVVEAARVGSRPDEGRGPTTLSGNSTLKFQRLSDEQWGRILHLIKADADTRRGRPRADMRTIIDAILYRIHTGIAWRELPTEFGSWQTASRHYRQLIASYQWDEIIQALKNQEHSNQDLDF